MNVEHLFSLFIILMCIISYSYTLDEECQLEILSKSGKKYCGVKAILVGKNIAFAPSLCFDADNSEQYYLRFAKNVCKIEVPVQAIYSMDLHFSTLVMDSEYCVITERLIVGCSSKFLQLLEKNLRSEEVVRLNKHLLETIQSWEK